MAEFDASRAWLKGPDYFSRFVVDGPGVPLEDAGLSASIELVVIEQSGQKAAFLMRELSHPHMAQGRLAGTPYLVTF